MPEVKKRLPTTNIVLFILTVLSVMLAGAQPEGPVPADMWGQILLLAKSILTGWPFAASLMGILLAHEFGHYLMSRYHKTAATLPYFIPMPFSFFGTMGAFIQMQSIPKNKRILFDIGIAGPLAGMVVAIPVLFLGLSLSRIDTVKNTSYPPEAPGVQVKCSSPVFLPDGSYTCADDDFIEGNSLFYLGLKYLKFGQLLPAPENYTGQSPLLYWLRYFFTGSPVPIGGMDVMIDPIAFAGWAGLLVTALNLIPVGTLDGGHITYALFGEKIRKAYPFVIGILVAMGFVAQTWWLWAVLLLWLGRVHAEPLDQITELDPRRRALGWFAILLFILVFTPVPMIIF
jgi:membrane-associated protease RseP (regulator of RpoE activity)